MSQLELTNIVVEQVVDGIEMGVLEDSTAFLSMRSLATLCGVHHRAISDLARGVGLTVVQVGWLPWGALLRSDRLYVRDREAIFWGVARVLLAAHTHTEADVETLAERLREKSSRGR